MITRITAADLRSPEYLADPFPLWRRLREDHPLFYDELADRWILSRYDDVVAVLSDPAVYSARTYQQRFRPVFGRTLAELDGPRHIRERTIVAPALVGRSLEGYTTTIENTIADLTPALSATTVDLVAAVTSKLPVLVIADLLGVPPRDREFVSTVGHALLDGLADDPSLRSAGADAHQRFSAYLLPMLDRRRAQPEEDLISRVVHGQVDGEGLTTDELCSFISFLLVAGGPTTDMALRNLWWALLTVDGELAACRDDPGRLDRAFSESLRRDGPIIYEDRRTNAPVEWYGQILPADTDILVCLGAANTDDTVFDDPERFDPDRVDLLMGVERKPGHRSGGVAGHLAFGLGSHFCMGYQLARLEAVRATSRLLLECGDVTLIEPVAPHITWYERTVDRLVVSTSAL